MDDVGSHTVVTDTRTVPREVGASNDRRFVGSWPDDPGSTSAHDFERRSGVQRLHTWADAIAFMAALNLMIVGGTLAGGIVAGSAPSATAAVAVSRARIRGEAFSLPRRFVRVWREEFAHANLLQLRSGSVLALLVVNIWIFSRPQDLTPLVLAFAIAAGLTLTYHLTLVVMDAHYELSRALCRRRAGQFLIRFPGAPLLLAATTALVAVGTFMLPGLLPVISIGAWLYLCTALCMSFFAANERSMNAQAALSQVDKQAGALGSPEPTRL